MEEADDRERHPSPGTAALESIPGLFRPSSADDDLSHQMYFSELSHSLQVLQGLNKQRGAAALCDVTVCADGHEFPCHRNVLAACSNYFYAMFTGELKESSESRVTIANVDAVTLRQLIDYAYTADICIHRDNAQYLLSAANMIQLQAVVDACCSFLEKEMDPSNCLGIHCFAEAHTCQPLSTKAKIFTLENFTEVAKHEELLMLVQDKLVEFIQTDDLVVEKEETVLQAVIDWVKHDLDVRRVKFAEVLGCVRLPLVNPYFLLDTLQLEPFLTDTAGCRPLLDEALRCHLLKDRVGDVACPRLVPRIRQRQNNLIVIIGGEIQCKNYLNNVDSYDLTASVWSRLKELPFPRCHHGAAVSGGRHIYVAGGFNREKHVLNNTLRYEPCLDKWIKVANMNTARVRHGMAALDGHVYVVGGHDGQSRTDSVERYSPTANTWSYVAPMSTALSRCQAVGLNGLLYVVGGTTEPNNVCVDLVQCYNPRTDTWTALCRMSAPRCPGGVVCAGGLLYAVGGTEESVRASRRLSAYSPATDRWTDLSCMIEPRFDAGVASIGNKILVMSGQDGENSFYNSMEEYDLTQDTWSLLTHTALPYGRCRFGCVAIQADGKG